MTNLPIDTQKSTKPKKGISLKQIFSFGLAGRKSKPDSQWQNVEQIEKQNLLSLKVMKDKQNKLNKKVNENVKK